MTEQIINMNELIQHMSELEQRINKLETENSQLRSIVPANPNPDGNAIAKYVARVLPQTNIINPNFLKRAFTVWGHFFVANLIIGITVGICYACLMMTLFGSVFNSILQNNK